MNTSQTLYLRISPGKFHLLKFILEGYDNFAILSSHDSRNGIVMLRHTPEMAEEIFSLLKGIAQQIKA